LAAQEVIKNIERRNILFRYNPEIKNTYKNDNIVIINKMSDITIKNLAKLFVELIIKYSSTI